MVKGSQEKQKALWFLLDRASKVGTIQVYG